MDERIERILQELATLSYGTLVITVHDSQITQIEKTEKYRFATEKIEKKK